MAKDERPSCRGAMVVESALLFLAAAMVMIGVQELGTAWRVRRAIGDAAWEGCRVASRTTNLQPDDPAVVHIIDDVLRGNGVDPAYCIRWVLFPSPLAEGNPVRVVVRYHTPQSGVNLPLVRDMEANAELRYEP